MYIALLCWKSALEGEMLQICTMSAADGDDIHAVSTHHSRIRDIGWYDGVRWGEVYVPVIERLPDLSFWLLDAIPVDPSHRESSSLAVDVEKLC